MVWLRFVNRSFGFKVSDGCPWKMHLKSKKFWLSTSKFTQYLIMKHETCSFKICRILKIILSSSLKPCSSILVWKLIVWMDWEMPWPLPMGNRVKKLRIKLNLVSDMPRCLQFWANLSRPSSNFRRISWISTTFFNGILAIMNRKLKKPKKSRVV